METINPNDITEVDKNSISLITLKNGNMIMIDDSVPEKPKTEKKQINDEQPKSEKKPQPLSISQHLTCSFEGKEQPVNKNLEKISEKIVEKKIIVKSDFNSLSKVSKNTNFTYSGIPREKATNNNFSNFKYNNNQNTQMTNFNGIIDKTNNLDFSKSLNNFSPIQMANSNANTNIKNQNNFNSNILLNNNDINNSNNPKVIQFEESNISTNNNLDANNEDENKEEDVNSRINKKSRNYLERIEKMVGDKHSHTIKAVISLYIPCENPTVYTKTQKQFDKLMAQLRGRQNKNRRKKDEINYPKYYHLYKDNHDKIFNGIIGPKEKRIKYYEEAEAEDKENEIHINPNETLFKSSLNNNSIVMNNSISNNTFYSGFNNNNNINNKNNKNKSISNIGFGNNDLNKTSGSFYGNKTRATSENKMLSSRLVGSNLGFGSGLIYPCNKFVKKYNYKFL
jgi:hypothetical protein